MDEKYIQDLYDHLGGQEKFGKFDDFKHLMSNDSTYRKDFYDAFGEKQLGAYNDFDTLVKKKVSSNVTPTTSGNGLSSTPKAKDPLQEALDARSRQRKESVGANISMPRNASDVTATNLQQKTEMIDDNVLNRQSEASLKKENEEFKQQALKTTAERRLKAKGKTSDEKALTEEKAAVQKDIDEGNLILSSDGRGNKIYARQPGMGESFLKNLSSSINSLADAGTIAAVKATGSPEELAALYEMIALRKRQESEKEFTLEDITNPLKSLPTDKEVVGLPTAEPGVAGTLTGMVGGLGPDVAMAMGTGGLSAAARTAIIASKMELGSYGNKAPELYEKNKQENMRLGMSEQDASVKAAQDATVDAVLAAAPDAAVNTLFFSSGKLHTPLGKNLLSALKATVKNTAKVSGLGVAGSLGTSAIEGAEGYNVDDWFEKAIGAGGEYGEMELIFSGIRGMKKLPKATRSLLKEFAVDPVVNPVVESYLKSVPEDIANRIRVELQDYKSATEPVRGVVPEEKMASLGGRMQKRQNRINGINIIKGDIEALEAKKKDLPEPLHEEINAIIKEREGQIKELEKEIETVDKEIGEINKSKETGLEKEIDEATGEPLIPKEEPTPPKGEVSTVSESEVDSRVEEINKRREAELEIANDAMYEKQSEEFKQQFEREGTEWDNEDINAKYDAEIAALPKQEAKPTVSSEGELTQRQLDNREKKRIEDIVESVEGGDIKGSSISVGDKDLVEYLIDAGMWGREAHVVKGEIEGLIKPLKRITDKIDPEELKFLTENVEDINSVMEGLEDAKMMAFSRNKDIVDGVNKEAKRLLDFYSDKSNLADNKLDTESTFAAKVDLLDKFLKGELNYLDLSKFGVEKKAKDYFKPKIKQVKKLTQSKEPSTPVSEGKTKVENEAATQKPIEPVEPIKAEEVITPKETVIEVSEGGGEPPKGETVSSGIYSEPKRTEFSHRGLQEVATEFGLDPVTSRERKSDAELFRRVDETLSEWTKSGEYNKKIEELLQRDRVKKPISDEENVIIAQHIAQLRKQGGDIRKEAGINSPEYNEKLKELNEVVRVGEAIRSEQGAALRVPIFSREYMPTLEDAMSAKMDAVGTDVLTPKQKVEVEKQFEKIEKERDEYKAKLEAANAKFAEMQAQSELSKPASKGKTTAGKRDYKAERQSLKDRLKEEVAAYKAAGQKMGIASDGGAESFVVSAKIAKTITEIAKTHVAEAGAKIKEVVEKTLEDVREYFGDKITDRDIMDVLAGKYNEKRKTRSQLAADMREVQTEAKLLNEYQRLLEGGEPKNEKRQIQRNKRLAEIRKELKGLEELDKEIQTSKDAELQVRIDKNKETVDKLDKLEKEDARAAEKKRKEIEAENLKELAKLKEEFDKKVRENERKKKEDEIALNKKLKEQADEKQRQMDKEAREYEQKLREEEIQRKKDEIALVKELDRKLKYKSPAERAAAQAIERNKKREQEVREKITNKDFDEKKKPVSFWEEPSFKKNHPDLYKQVLDSYNKKEEAQLDYELELLKDAEGKKTKTQKVLDWLGRGANTTKKVVTGIDDSSLFMQTLAAMTARPFVAGQAIRLHALDAVSKKRFDRNLAELHNSPDYPLMQKSGLDITEPKSLSATAHEEAFSGKSWDITFKKGGKEYKVLQTMLSPFERAFTSLGNGMRVIAFRSLAEKFEREGHTFENNPQLYKDLATMLNTETGRGKQNELIERASNLITKGIWSPKLMASRLNMLGISDAISFIPGMDKAGTKGYYRQLTPEIRKQAVKDLAKFSATVMAVSSLVAYALGGKVDNDPDSVTYLDIQTPDGKSYNISGGFAQYIKLVAQTISGGKRKNGILEEFKGEKSEGSNIMRFGRGKLTPLAGVITDFATGKDFMGKEVEPLEEAKKLAIPLSLQSVATELKRDGLSSLFTATLPSFVGIQVKDDRDFEKKGDKKQGMPQKKQKPTKEKKYAQ